MMDTPHTICSSIHTASEMLATPSLHHTSTFIYYPLSQFICSPPDTSLPASLLHHLADADQSNARVKDRHHYPISSHPFNGLGIHCAESAPDSLEIGGLFSLGQLQTSKDFFSGAIGDYHGSHLAIPPFPLHYNLSGGYVDFNPTSTNTTTTSPQCRTLSPQLTWPISGTLCAHIHGSPAHVDDTTTLSDQMHSPPFHEKYPAHVSYTPPMFPPFPDINMFQLAASRQEPSAGVDPAEISIATFDSEEWPRGESDSPSSTPFSPPRASTPVNPPLVHELSAEVLNEIMSILSNSAVSVTEDAMIKKEDKPITLSSFDPNDSWTYSQKVPEHTFPPSSPTFPSPVSSPFPSPCRKSTNKRPLQEMSRNACDETTGCAPDLGTPVLDAHHGIPLSELSLKAERYRLRNPGQEIDKRWLSCFAGKLSARGELLEDFRCYVLGCSQTNKRRDHILIHIGSHVNQRPFSCGYCSMRFLRKNERKRHEATHTGHKPYVCDVCPLGEKAFVRLDLLRRHLKRTHAIDPSADKENRSSLASLKRAKLEL